MEQLVQRCIPIMERYLCHSISPELENDQQDSAPIPETLRSMLAMSRAWDDPGVLRLTPRWTTLQDLTNQVGRLCGVYVLGLPCGVSYDGGASRIIYIGSTEPLHERLTKHLARPHRDCITIVEEAASEPLLGCYWPFPELPI